MENLTHMAVGFADGTVLVYKGDITRDRYKFQVMMSFPLYEALSPYCCPANVNSYQELYIGCVNSKSI